MSSIVQNDTTQIKFFMTLASDASGRTPAPDLSPLPVFKIDKGAGMGAGGGVVTQAPTKGGWYYYTPVTADVNTLCDLGMEASAATADTWRDIRRVVQAGATDATATAIKAKTDNLPPDPADESLIIAATDSIMAAVGAVPSAVQNADALLARNQKGGADGPPEESVSAALAGGFFLFSGGDTATITINNGDGTPAFTRTLSRDLTKLLGAIIAATA